MYLTYAAALGVAAVIPGPGIAALIGQSLGAGFRSALFMIAGIAAGDVVYLTLVIVGLAAVTEMFAGAFVVIKLLGGAYLIYLAYRFWTQSADVTRVQQGREASGGSTMLAGLGVTLGNPKAIVFYLALVPNVLDLGAIDPASWLILSVITVAVLFAALMPYALLAARARHMMQQPHRLRQLNRTAAGVIGGAGLIILAEAVWDAVP